MTLGADPFAAIHQGAARAGRRPRSGPVPGPRRCRHAFVALPRRSRRERAPRPEWLRSRSRRTAATIVAAATSRRVFHGQRENIAGVAHGLDAVLRKARVDELLPQPADLDVDIAVE